MAWFGKGKYIGTDRDLNLNRDNNNAYGVWSVNTVKDYVQNSKWAFPAIAIGAIGGSISTVTVGSTSYRIHQFDSNDTFTIFTSSSEMVTIEVVGAGGNMGNSAFYGTSYGGCGSGAAAEGGPGGGAGVVIASQLQFTPGNYTVYVGDPVNGSSFVTPAGTLIKSSNGGSGGNASPAPPASSSPGPGGIAGTTYASPALPGPAVISYSATSGGAGGFSNTCVDSFGSSGAGGYASGNFGNNGYVSLMPTFAAIPLNFSTYSTVLGPSSSGIVTTTRNRGLGNGPTNPNFSPTGGSRGGIIRIIYKFIQ